MRRDEIYQGCYSDWDLWQFIKGLIDDIMYKEFYIGICGATKSIKYNYNEYKKYSLEKIIKGLKSKEIDLKEYCAKHLVEQLRLSEDEVEQQDREIRGLKLQIEQFEQYKKNNTDNSKLVKMYKPIVHNSKIMAVNVLETVKMLVLEDKTANVIDIIDAEINRLKED